MFGKNNSFYFTYFFYKIKKLNLIIITLKVKTNICCSFSGFLACIWKAKQKQLISKEEMGTNCCYAVQDKFWVSDPDGVQWEVYYFHADAEFNDPHYETQSATACCTPKQETQKTGCC